MDFVNSRILSKSGRVLFDINGNIVVKNVYGLRVNNSQLSAKDVKFAVNVTGVDGFYQEIVMLPQLPVILMPMLIPSIKVFGSQVKPI